MTEQIKLLRINYKALPVPPCPASRRNIRQRFRCWLDDGSPVGPSSGLLSPAYDGARTLIASGVSPDCVMTTRAASSSCDSWPPASVASFARLAVFEGDDDPAGLKVRLWVPFPPSSLSEKQGNSAVSGASLPADTKTPENLTGCGVVVFALSKKGVSQ